MDPAHACPLSSLSFSDLKTILSLAEDESVCREPKFNKTAALRSYKGVFLFFSLSESPSYSRI